MRMQSNRPPRGPANRPLSRRRLVEMAGLAVLLVLAAVAERWQGPKQGQKTVEMPVSGEVTGHPKLTDGDSFLLGGDEVRMVGIDAPEGRQSCTRDGKAWACGEAAKRELARLIGGRSITCGATERDQHQRLLSRCKVGGIELNRQMVANGFAVSFGRLYQREEQEARQQRRGIWASEFDRPQDWRHANGIGGTH